MHFLRRRRRLVYHLQAGILDVSGHPAGQQAAILWALSCGVPPTHWGCVAVDITPHHPRHWPERVIFGNQKPSKQIESLGQDVFSRSGQPVAFTLTEGTFLTLPPSSLTVVIPPLIAVICVEVNT